jgi:WhiB family redox-sensing transcriptional regulator
MTLRWQPLVVDTDPDDPLYLGDPADLLAELADRPAWHRRALCHGQTHVFFPGRGEDSEPAKATCQACPVQVECAEAGRRERFGIWAGMSERQRRAARRTAA